MIQSVYLDANASEPVRETVMDAMMQALRTTGNPSSVHAFGRKVYNMVEDARETIAGLFGGTVQNCIFTSGGSEANNLAIYGQKRNRPVWIGATEHPSVMQIDLSKEILPVTAQGTVDLDVLEERLKKATVPPLVCLMLANNETGILHPIRQAADLCHHYGALLHVDATQAAGRMPLDLEMLGADSLVLSAHKMGGPKGVGALLLASDGQRNAKALEPIFIGGGQEQGRRGGTQAIPAIVGMARAARDACGEDRSPILKLRNRLEEEAKRLGAIVCGEDTERLDNTSCLAFAGIDSQRQMMALDMAGFCVSSGSACSSGKVNASYMLLAMGLGELASCVIRVSLPWNVQEKEVDAFLDAYRHLVQKESSGK